MFFTRGASSNRAARNWPWKWKMRVTVGSRKRSPAPRSRCNFTRNNATMPDVMEEKDIYLSNFAQFEKAQAQKGPGWLHRLRSAAIDRFAELGFPTLRDEE